MAGKDSENKYRQPRPGDKLDALRIALQQKEKPSPKFMKAFETLMRKENEGKD